MRERASLTREFNAAGFPFSARAFYFFLFVRRACRRIELSPRLGPGNSFWAAFKRPGCGEAGDELRCFAPRSFCPVRWGGVTWKLFLEVIMCVRRGGREAEYFLFVRNFIPM